VLARAFASDPSMVFMLPDPRRRERRLPLLMEAMLRKSVHHGATEVVADGTTVLGVAVWDPPGAPAASRLDELVRLARYARALGSRFSAGAVFGGALEAAHPKEPHWYLSLLGTSPDARRRGVGSRLLDSRLELCDAAGEAAYLETNTEANVGFYRRFGLTVMAEIDIPDGGPRTWAMWRDPR